MQNNNKKASSSSSGMISTRRLLVGCFCYECCVDVKSSNKFFEHKVLVSKDFSDDDDTFNFWNGHSSKNSSSKLFVCVV